MGTLPFHTGSSGQKLSHKVLSAVFEEEILRELRIKRLSSYVTTVEKLRSLDTKASSKLRQNLGALTELSENFRSFVTLRRKLGALKAS